MHTLVIDGVFSEPRSGQLTFHPAPPPSDEEVAHVLAPVRARVGRLLAHRQLEPAADTAPPDPLAEVSPVLAGLVGASVQGRQRRCAPHPTAPPPPGPRRTPFVRAATASTVPEPSCPSTAGSAMVASPFWKWRSLRQTPAAPILISTSPRRGGSSSTVSTEYGLLTSWSTAAVM